MTQKRSGMRKICLCTIIYSTKRFHYVHIISTVPSSWHTFMVKLTVFSYHFEWIFNRVSCQLHTSIHFSKSFVLFPILLIYVLFSRNNSMPESWVNEKNKKGWAKYKQKIFFIGNIFFSAVPIISTEYCHHPRIQYKLRLFQSPPTPLSFISFFFRRI